MLISVRKFLTEDSKSIFYPHVFSSHENVKYCCGFSNKGKKTLNKGNKIIAEGHILTTVNVNLPHHKQDLAQKHVEKNVCY